MIMEEGNAFKASLPETLIRVSLSADGPASAIIRAWTSDEGSSWSEAIRMTVAGDGSAHTEFPVSGIFVKAEVISLWGDGARVIVQGDL